MSVGSYKIWTADKAGTQLDWPPKDATARPDPSVAEAVQIYFGLPPDVPQPPPKDQADLHSGIAKVLRAIQILFADDNKEPTPAQKAKFRLYYVRLFRLAQLGLEGPGAGAGATSVATSALASVTADLIDDEAGHVKNNHLKVLGRVALLLSLPFAFFYLFLRCVAGTQNVWLAECFKHLQINALAANNV